MEVSGVCFGEVGSTGMVVVVVMVVVVKVCGGSGSGGDGIVCFIHLSTN